MADSNRRRFPRVPLNRVSTRVKSRDKTLHIGLPVDNMSLGGCFVRSATPLRPGTEVQLEIQRPGASRTINVLGRVVSNASATKGHPAGMGVAFLPMSSELSQRIEGLIGAVDPAAVRVSVDLAQQPTDPAIPVLSRAPSAGPEAQVATLRAELMKRDARIAELEGLVERLRERLRGSVR